MEILIKSKRKSKQSWKLKVSLFSKNEEIEGVSKQTKTRRKRRRPQKVAQLTSSTSF